MAVCRLRSVINAHQMIHKFIKRLWRKAPINKYVIFININKGVTQIKKEGRKKL